MATRSYEKLNCPISGLLSLVGEQWTLLIVRDLALGLTRFEDLQRSLGISRNILTQRLNRLTEEGFVTKSPVRAGISRWHYTPTEKCLELLPVLIAMAEWGEKWTPHPQGTRMVTIDAGTGSPVRLELRRTTDQVRVALEDLAFRAGPGADPGVKRYVREL